MCEKKSKQVYFVKLRNISEVQNSFFFRENMNFLRLTLSIILENKVLKNNNNQKISAMKVIKKIT